MASQAKPHFTPEEYLAIERGCSEKNEYFNGEVFAMSGASEKHNLITGNVFASLHSQMKAKPCKVYASEMRVKVSKTGLYTYPDPVALCGDANLEDAELDALLNPSVIIEVLSKPTEGYDRGEKFAQYRRLTSLFQCVLISQETLRIESFFRQHDSQWLMSVISQPNDKLELPTVQCSFLLADVYDKVIAKEA